MTEEQMREVEKDMESIPCECGSPVKVERGRGWWCTKPTCKFSKKKKDVRKGDTYFPWKNNLAK